MAPGEEILYFTTGEEPKITGLTVSPVAGLMFATNFTVTLSDYQVEEPPYEFMLFGEKGDSSGTRFRLTPTFEELSSDGITEISMELPNVVGIVAEIRDFRQEVVDIKAGVRSKHPDDFDDDAWFDYFASKKLELSGDQVALW